MTEIRDAEKKNHLTVEDYLVIVETLTAFRDYCNYMLTRLGPPKAKMTEAEVRAIAEQMTADAKWDSMMIDILVNFARRLGVLSENET